MPRVSVIVPVYNTAKYLDKCLRSLINQTMQDIEIIIVNDGSTDNSDEIIKQYLKKYPNKIKYYAKENEGLSATRNYAVEQAIGDYISFVDSDDFVDENLYQNLEKEMSKEVDLIKFKMIKIDINSAKTQRITGPVFDVMTGQEAFNLLVFKDILIEPACIYLYKRTTFLQHQFKFTNNRYNEDFGLIPIILLKSETVISTDIYGYNYVQSNISITRNNDYEKKKKSAYDLLYYYDNLQKEIEKIKINTKTKENILQYYTNAILLATKKLKKEDEKNYIKEIKKRKLIKNIKPRNIKQILKKIILIINIKIYLKLK